MPAVLGKRGYAARNKEKPGGCNAPFCRGLAPEQLATKGEGEIQEFNRKMTSALSVLFQDK